MSKLTEKNLEFLAELGTWIIKLNWTVDMTESISLWNEISGEMGCEKKIKWDDYYDQTTYDLKYSFEETKDKIRLWLKS